MSFYLGIDLGTTYTAAATERGGTVEALTLGNRTASVPSVVFLRDDGEFLIGEAATRRASTDPGRVAREFKRRIGDPTPIILGGTPYAAEMLMARMLRWSLDRVVEQQGNPPKGIALTHPANWGPYKLDLLQQAVRQVDVDADLFLPEPVAAATFYASQRRLDAGAVVAVYDLGGGTFDAAMVRRTPNGFESIGSPEGIERLGGIDFDEAVVAFVRDSVGDALEQLDPEDATALAAMTRLRQECIDAKEALSSDTDVSIPVLLPNLQTEVRLTRSEFENMIRPAISETITALRRSIRSSDVSDDEISAVLLVGGSSRIPLVAQMVGAELGRPIAIDAHPKDAISFGAAIAVAERKGQATPESVKTVLPTEGRPPPPTMAVLPGQPGMQPGPPGYRQPPPGQGGPRPGAPNQMPPGRRPGAPMPTPQGSGGQAAPGPRPAAPAAHAGPPGAAAGQGAVAAGQRPAPGTVPSGERPAAAPVQSGERPVPPGYGASPAAARPGAAGAGAAGAYGQRAGGQQAAGGYGSGGYRAASGGYQAASSGQGVHHSGFPAAAASDGDDQNRTLWLIVGVVGVIAAILLAMALTSGGGDDDNAGRENDPGGQPSDSATTTAPDPSEGYTDVMETQFVEGCVDGIDGSGSGATEAECQCIFDEISATIPVEDFFSMSLEMDPSSGEVPDELVPAMASCYGAT